MSSSYNSSDEEWDLQEEVDITIILAFHANKRRKHGGYILGREALWRERIDDHNKLMQTYFVRNPTTLSAIFVAVLG